VENAIETNSENNVFIQGPGLVRRFNGFGNRGDWRSLVGGGRRHNKHLRVVAAYQRWGTFVAIPMFPIASPYRYSKLALALTYSVCRSEDPKERCA
jgi:hypothetical protein